jgi:hypothetical protein
VGNTAEEDRSKQCARKRPLIRPAQPGRDELSGEETQRGQASSERPERQRWRRRLREQRYGPLHLPVEKDVEDAAFRRLIAILPKNKPGTVEYDLWRTIYAFEHVLTSERGKTTRLSRTRQKVARVGEIETLKDRAIATQSTDGFNMLIGRD